MYSQQQQQYWQNQAQPNARYPPNQYPNQYPNQHAPPAFKSQAELGFDLPPVRTAPPARAIAAQPQRPGLGQPQRSVPGQQPPPMHMQSRHAVPPPMQGRPRPQSMGYPPVNTGYAPPVHANPHGVGVLPSQLVSRSSSASPTRKPLPAPASPSGGGRPLTVTQSSGYPPVPPPMRAQSIDLSAFSRFNQERMASGAITAGVARNTGPFQTQPNIHSSQYGQQQQQQQPQQSPIPMPQNRAPAPSFPQQFSTSPQRSYEGGAPVTPTRRRASPPRFFGTGSVSPSRNNSPEKSGFNHQTPTQKAQPVYSNYANESQIPSFSTPSQSRSQPDYAGDPSSSFQRPPQPPSANLSFATTGSAAIRHRNPIFDPPSPTSAHVPSPAAESKFVPMWKRSSISQVNGKPTGGVERGRPVSLPPSMAGRPLPQPSNFSSQYTVEEPEDDTANTSFGSDTDVSEVSAVSAARSSSSATSAASQMSRASNGPGILDLQGKGMPQPPGMNRDVATTGALPRGSRGPFGGASSGFNERQIPQPPGMDRGGATTGVIHEGGGSMTLRFAKMGLESNGNGGTWPADLPPLPRGPGSGIANGSAGSRPQSRHSQVNTPSTPSRHSHSHSQPQSQSAFASTHGPRGRSNRVALDYDPDEPPPRPASASFSARSVSPASSTTSSTTGVLERFRKNVQQQPQPQRAIFQGSSNPNYGRAEGDNREGYSGHTYGNGFKIESPAPLGGKEKTADFRRMEDDSSRSSEIRGVPRITFGNENEDESPSNTPAVPRITFGEDNRGEEASHASNSGPPRITFGDEDDESSMSGPMIRISGEEENRNGSHNQPPQIVFEVPGVGVASQFGGGPSISVSADDEHVSQHRGGPRVARSQIGPGVPQNSGRSGGLTCPACSRPIVGRIVGAMGVKWHPDCFRCCICRELLEFQSSYEGVGEDGIRRPYCHLDYHETFAPKCYHCKTAIVEERFISLNDPALGRRTYHEPHFFCAECGDPFLSPSSAASHNRERDFGKGAAGNDGEVSFSGDGTFAYDNEDDNVGFTVYKGHPYCETCHVRLRLPKCKRCRKPIRDHMEAVEALGGKWCWDCFRCTNCDKPFEDPSFFERDKKPYCENCFSIIIRNEI